MKKFAFVFGLVALSGCVPETSPTTPKPANTTAPQVQSLSFNQFQNLGSVPAETPVVAIYRPFEQHLNTNSSGTIESNSSYYLAPCTRSSVDDVVGRIADEGKKRSNRVRGLRNTTLVQIDALSSARKAYQAAQSECGFDYSNELTQISNLSLQAERNLAALSANQSSGPSASEVASILNGVASIISATRPSTSGGSSGGISCEEDPEVTNCY